MLTLCVITKDEESFLPGLLASVQGVVDRIVLVDTGSQDQTLAIAQAAGAILCHHAWNKDFAAARNAALGHIQEGWILQLDADERLSPQAGALLRARLQDDNFDAALLPLYNAESLTDTFETILRTTPILLPRLFRWSADFCWEGAIHEQPYAWLTAPKRRLIKLDAPILHYGYVPELLKQRHKSHRNIDALRQRLQQSPDDVSAYTYLAFELYQSKNYAEADPLAAAGWQVAQKLRAQGQRPPLVSLAGMRVQRLLGQGDLIGAQAILREAQAYTTAHPNLDWLEGRCFLFMAISGDTTALSQAEAAFRRALSWDHPLLVEPLMDGVCGYQSEIGLGTVLLMQQRYEEAQTVFRSALQAHTDDQRARFGFWEARIAQGEAFQVLKNLQPLLNSATPESPRDLWFLATLACQALGLEAEAEKFLIRSRQPGRWLSAHRQALAQRLSSPLAG